MTTKFSAFLLLLNTTCFSGEEAQNIQASFQGQLIEGKYYVVPGTVYVAPDGIYIFFQDTMIPVRCLGSDANGVYVLESDLTVEKRWECRTCHKYNSDGRAECVNGCDDF